MEGNHRPVGESGQRRPGSTEFDDLDHDMGFRFIMLASQAGNQSLGTCCGSEVVQGAWSACARTFDDVQIDHGGGDVVVTAEFLNGF